jgi:hypothetical protein
MSSSCCTTVLECVVDNGRSLQFTEFNFTYVRVTRSRFEEVLPLAQLGSRLGDILFITVAARANTIRPLRHVVHSTIVFVASEHRLVSLRFDTFMPLLESCLNEQNLPDRLDEMTETQVWTVSSLYAAQESGR